MTRFLMPDEPISRYDEVSETKFDFEERQQPDCEEFRFIEEMKAMFDEQCPDRAHKPSYPLAATILADINLKTRGLVGIVLGSTLKKLYHPPADLRSINSHSDLDVLILQPHSPHHPAPNEWGVDWWVRPQSRPPINGRVELWYDIAMQGNVNVEQNLAETETALSLDVDNWNIRYNRDLHEQICLQAKHTRKTIQQRVLSPGLYLPHPTLIRQIVDHCNKRIDQKEHDKQRVSQMMEEVPFLLEYSKVMFEGSSQREPRECFNVIIERALNLEKEYNAIYQKHKGNRHSLGQYLSNFIQQKAHNPMEILSKIVEVALYALKDMRRDLEGGFKNYNYLRVSPRNARPLWPVLPPHVADFRPL